MVSIKGRSLCSLSYCGSSLGLTLVLSFKCKHRKSTLNWSIGMPRTIAGTPQLIHYISNYSPHCEMSGRSYGALQGPKYPKMIMPLKPTKREYKVWSLCDSKNGYMVNFDVYAGKGKQREANLGIAVVKNLAQPLCGKNHILFFDNFFSDVELAHSLLEQNRKKFPSSLRSVKFTNCGDTKSELVEGNTIQCLVWLDKKLVSLVNTAYDPLAI